MGTAQADFEHLTEDDLVSIGVPLLAAKKIKGASFGGRAQAQVRILFLILGGLSGVRHTCCFVSKPEGTR
jgi:hypothetical protein